MTEDKVLDKYTERKLPEKFPVATFPTPQKTKVVEVFEEELDENMVRYGVSYMSLLKRDELIDYYKGLLEPVEEKNLEKDTSNFLYSGISKGFYFEIFGDQYMTDNIETWSIVLAIEPYIVEKEEE